VLLQYTTLSKLYRNNRAYHKFIYISKCYNMTMRICKWIVNFLTLSDRRIENINGIIFDVLEEGGFGISQLTSSNIWVLRNLQGIVTKINGAILCSINGMNILSEITCRLSNSRSIAGYSLSGNWLDILFATKKAEMQRKSSMKSGFTLHLCG